MDYPVIDRSEGFPGQRIVRLPSNTAETCWKMPVVQGLFPESIGHFPLAKQHLIHRPAGIDNQLVLLCASGAGFLHIAGQRHPIAAGHIALIPRGMPHGYGASEQQPWGKYWTHFNGRDADAIMDKLQLRPHEYVYALADSGEAVKHFEWLHHWAIQAHTEEVLLQIHGHLLAWLLCLLRQRGGAAAAIRDSQARILTAMQQMQEACERPHSPVDLAKACGMSEASFYRRFKQQAGCTPNAYLLRLRMQKACQLLDMTEDPISEIGRAVGYEDPYYFSRMFTRSMGMSPSRYRQSDIGSSLGSA